MSKPDITLQPSKGIISEAAARIYAGYIAAGLVPDDDVQPWIKRSIREAIVIAKTVDASIDSHDTITIDESIVVHPNPSTGQPERAKKSSPTKSTQTSKQAKPRKRDETIEELAEEVLFDEAPANETVPFELDEGSGDSAIEDSAGAAASREKRNLESKDDTDIVA
jgi:hypothetical protein